MGQRERQRDNKQANKLGGKKKKRRRSQKGRGGEGRKGGVVL